MKSKKEEEKIDKKEIEETKKVKKETKKTKKEEQVKDKKEENTKKKAVKKEVVELPENKEEPKKEESEIEDLEAEKRKQKVNNIIKKAKEKGKITYGELATELDDINPDQIDKVFDEFEKMGVDLLKDDFEDLKLIIAPRHLENVENIENMLNSKSILSGKKSTDASFDKCDVIILDTTGELSNIYSICDVCVICGSFDKTGGHNPLEATIWGKPVISGPNIKNFRYIYKNLTEQGCAIIVKSTEELKDKVAEFLSDEKYIERISTNCTNAIEKNSGATDFTINYIEKFNREQYENN